MTQQARGSVSLKQDYSSDAEGKKRELNISLTGDTAARAELVHSEPEAHSSDLENKDQGSSLWKHITSKSEFIYWAN